MTNHLSLQIDRTQSTAIVATLTTGPGNTATWAKTEILPAEARCRCHRPGARQDHLRLGLRGRRPDGRNAANGSLSERARQHAECLRKAEAFLTGNEDDAHDAAISCREQAIGDGTTDLRFYSAYALTTQLPYLREMKPLTTDANEASIGTRWSRRSS